MEEASRCAKVKRIKIMYAVDGSDRRPWLVVSNYLATNISMLDAQAQTFAGRLRVLRYDQRGHGASDAPAGRYPFDVLIADVLALMDALGISRAHFAGLSMGGATGLGLAEQHPERLDKVIVCDTPCQSTPASKQQWEERIAIAQQHGMDALVEPTVGR